MSDTASAATALFDAPPATPAPAAEPAAVPAPPAAAATPPAEPFLQIDDRTKYATREDAMKGWKELNEYSGKLRPFEVLMKPVAEGGFGLTAEAAVAHLDAYANELATRQSAQAIPASGKSDAATVQAAAQGDKLSYDSLTPEWKAHVDHLKKLGYVTQDALKPIQDQVAALTERDQAAQKAHADAAVAHGTTLLTSVMKEAGITADDKMLERVGGVVGAAIDRDSYNAQGQIIPGSLADKFLRGNESVRKGIIQEQFNIFQTFGDVYHQSKTASYAATKSAAQSQQPRNLPPSNGAVPAERKGRATPEERAKRVTELLESTHA